MFTAYLGARSASKPPSFFSPRALNAKAKSAMVKPQTLVPRPFAHGTPARPVGAAHLNPDAFMDHGLFHIHSKLQLERFDLPQ